MFEKILIPIDLNEAAMIKPATDAVNTTRCGEIDVNVSMNYGRLSGVHCRRMLAGRSSACLIVWNCC